MELYASNPVDKIARTVTSQRGCTDSVIMSEKQEILDTVWRLKKRIKEIKNQLGVKNRTHWKELKYRANSRQQVYGVDKGLFFEARSIGDQINELNRRSINLI